MPAQNKVPEPQKDAVYKATQDEVTRKKLRSDAEAIAIRKATQNSNRGGRV